MSSIRRLLASAINAANGNDSDDDFEDIVQRTRSNFRPSRIQTPYQTRGRKKLFKKRCFLLKRSNSEYFPIKGECDMLKEQGFGFSKTKPHFDFKWNIADIEGYIASLYPEAPLELVGFQMAKMDRNKKLIRLRDIENVQLLKESLGQGQLIIIPNRDLPTPIAPNPQNEAETSSSACSTAPTACSTAPAEVHLQRRVTEVHTPLTREEIVASEFDFEDRDMDSQFPDDDAIIDITEDDASVQMFPNIDDNAETLIFEVTRCNVLSQMLEAYGDDSILFKKLKVVFSGEQGEDFGGLTKELFTIFWEACYSHYFCGEEVVVPHVSLHNKRTCMDKFTNIGRILIHMLTLTHTLPNKLSKSLILRLGNLDYKVPSEVIKEDFLYFLTKAERILLKKAESNLKDLTTLEMSLLEDLFQTYELYENPKESIISEQILTIAENVIVTKPFEFVRLMKNGIPLLFERFWFTLDTNRLNSIMVKQAPTRTKVINCLKLSDENLTQQQSSVFYYLKTFINSLVASELAQFLYFVTGSAHMPMNISITFSNTSGIARTPVAHTCSNLLELPISYSSYQDFSREMKAVLGSEFSYEYTQI